jgi:uncharacterized Ntn-hydrolase superfamily protein
MRLTPQGFVLSIVWSLVAGVAAPAHGPGDTPVVATFSIVAYDPSTGDLGVAVASKFFGVGSIVPWARAGVGAVATQSFANVRAGPAGLLLLAKGDSPEETVKALLAADPIRDSRQIAVIDAKGHTAAHTGDGCHAWAGHRSNRNFSVQGNLLAGEAVIEAMETAFKIARKQSGSELADWLMAALEAGQDDGGDKRGRQSAALLVVREHGGGFGANDRYIDLRVEDHAEPLLELARLLEIHKKFFAPEHRAAPERREKENP